MPGSGSVTGTPIPGGGVTGIDIAEPLPYTLLSLARFAQVSGINPVHFQGATTGTVFPVSPNSCTDVWPRHSWQAGDRVSHEDLARTILDVEEDITDELGYSPAPVFVSQEVHKFSQHYRRDVIRYTGMNQRGYRLSVTTDRGKVIQGGRRLVTKIATATSAAGTLSYSDEDGDGFAETATIAVPTTLTNADEIKIYHVNNNGAQEWEIRPSVSKTASGTTFTGVFRSWLFIDPDLQSKYPSIDGFSAIDISTTANYVAAVDVYRETVDFTQPSAVFYWEPKPRGVISIGGYCSACSGTGCPACGLIEQNGCLQLRNPELGIVVPTTATYDASAARWNQTTFTECRDPDLVKLYYYAGDISERNLRGVSDQMLSNNWARIIANMAIARLERPFCSCQVVTALSQKMQQDLAFTGTDFAYQAGRDLLDNPFGTKRGEVEAWMKVSKLRDRVIGGALV